MTTGEQNAKFDGESEAGFNEMRKYFRENFNTSLDQGDEFRFHEWMDSRSKELKRELMDDLDDYDMRGAYKECCQCESDDISWPWKFMKPNHPLFSVDSIYHGAIDQHRGGTYEGGELGMTEGMGITFRPSKKMLENTHPRHWIKGVFASDIPDIELLLPEEPDGE